MLSRSSRAAAAAARRHLHLSATRALPSCAAAPPHAALGCAVDDGDQRGGGGGRRSIPAAEAGFALGRGLHVLRRPGRNMFRTPYSPAFYSSTALARDEGGDKKKDGASSSSSSSSSKPRLEARFGKVGKFFDSLGDEVSKEMDQNKEMKSGLDEMRKQAEDLRKRSIGDKASLDDVVGKEKIEKARQEATEKMDAAAEEAKRRAEDLSKAASSASERLSSTFESMKEKVSETAGDSEFAQRAQEKAKGARDAASSAADSVASKVDTSEKSFLGKFFGAIKETLEEAKEDILGEAGRGADGRRKVARRKRRADEEGMRRVAQAFGMRGGRRMRRKKAKSGGAGAVPAFTKEQMGEAFAHVSGGAEAEPGDETGGQGSNSIPAEQLGAALEALGLEVSEEDLAEMVQSVEGEEALLDLARFQSVVGAHQEKLAAAAAAEGADAEGAAGEDEEDAMIDDPDWEAAEDPDSGDTYYYNIKTGDTSWDKPDQIPNPNSGATAKPKKADADAVAGGSDSDEEGEFRDWRSPEEEARGKSRYGRDDEMIMVDEEESSWQRIKDRLTATPIIQDILGAGSEGVRTFAKTDAGKQARKRLRKGRNKVEDLQEQWETSQNPYVFAVASAYDEMFAETPEGQAIKELRRLDNDFVLDEWLLDVEDDIAPLMLEAYITGNEKLMDGICADTCKAMVGAAISDRKQNGFVLDPTILDIRGANLMAARPLEKAPPLMVVGFQAQQVHCITDKKGEVVEGADDKVTNNFYILCMQRDWDDEAGELQWKIIEFSLMMQMDYV
jgi:hypothetical protein